MSNDGGRGRPWPAAGGRRLADDLDDDVLDRDLASGETASAWS